MVFPTATGALSLTMFGHRGQCELWTLWCKDRK